MRTWHKIGIGILAALILAFVIAVIIAHPIEQTAWAADNTNRPLVIAHQGGNRLHPGNTLYAYEHAAGMGADVLEMDMHSTSDGVLVLIHDATVDRTTDGTGRVNEMTLEEIKALDAGYHWTDDEGQTYPFRGLGITIPTLEEVFTTFPDMPMVIEIKQEDPSIAGSFCEMIREYGMQDTVMAASFHDETIRSFREVCPEIATSAAQNEVITFYVLKTLFLGAAYTPPAEAFQVPEFRSGLHVITGRFVSLAGRRGVQVHPWTINDEDDMVRMIDLGVDGIITDRPDLLLDLLER